MHAFLKCKRCDWIDYLEQFQKRCPLCGSRTESIEKLFAGEKITYTVMSVRMKKNKVSTTFEDFTEKFNEIILKKDLDVLFGNAFDRDRVNFMMRVYVWSILKKQPQLWLHLILVINGLKELMTLRIRKQIDQ